MDVNQQKKQELTGYNNHRGVNYLKIHLQKYSLLMDTFVSPELSAFKRLGITIDFLWCVIRYGAGINDYFQYRFFEKDGAERKTFIVGRKWKKIIKTCNGKINVDTFDNKSCFNTRFKEFLGRDWIDIDNCSISDYQSFADSHPTCLQKIKDGSGGNGILVYSFSGMADEYDQLKEKHVILEEIIVQDRRMADFNPNSVNTLRIVTITNEDCVKVMNAVFRCGNGEGVTDNFHHYGLAALIDVTTGEVYTEGVDKDNNRFAIHPKTGCPIKGFVIPYWNEIIDTVKRAALIEPTVRYVGWDIAIKNDGTICIIEGNCASDPDITQIPDQIGKWPMYEEVIQKLG